MHDVLHYSRVSRFLVYARRKFTGSSTLGCQNLSCVALLQGVRIRDVLYYSRVSRFILRVPAESSQVGL